MRRALVTTLACFFAGCTDVNLEYKLDDVVRPTVDDELTVTGSFCTSPAANVDYPVKVLFIVDGSGSQQFSDQNRQRVVAVEQAINALIGAGTTYFKVIVFNASVSATPSTTDCDVFTRSPDQLTSALNNLAEADSLTDYQGALAVAYSELKRDMETVSFGNPDPTCPANEPSPAELGRTKYVVILISDGMPDPQCTIGVGNDFDPVLGPPNPYLICENSNFVNCLLKRDYGMQGGTVCDAGQYGTCGNGAPGCAYNDSVPYCCDSDAGWDGTGAAPSALLFGGLAGDSELTGGNDYNQPYQILDKIEKVMELQERFQVGELRVHAGLVLDPLADPAIIAIFGDASQAAPLMKQVAETGNGMYMEFYGGDSIDFLRINFKAIKQQRVLRTFFADNRAARITAQGMMPDTDFDGLTDEQEFAEGTDPTRADSDQDGYSDLIEVRRRLLGFDPRDPCLPPIDDSTGDYRHRAATCDPTLLWTTVFPCSGSRTPLQQCAVGDGLCDAQGFLDSDRDGLHDCEEHAIHTNPLQPDTDRDGMLDLFEVIYGSDPERWDVDQDADKDTLPNGLEMEWHLHPLIQQSEEENRERYRYDRTVVGQEVDGRTCYDFAVRRIKLAYTLDSEDLPPALDGVGFNEIRIYILENMADTLAGAPLVRVACLRPRYIPNTLRMPAGTDWTPLDEASFTYLLNSEEDFQAPEDLFNSSLDCVTAQ